MYSLTAVAFCVKYEIFFTLFVPYRPPHNLDGMIEQANSYPI